MTVTCLGAKFVSGVERNEYFNTTGVDPTLKEDAAFKYVYSMAVELSTR